MKQIIKQIAVSVYTPITTVILISIAINLNTLWNGFVYDDDTQVIRNLWIRDVKNLPGILFSNVWSFEMPMISNYYRPLMYLVYMANYYLFGLEPWGWHLVNVLFHAGVTVMVFLVAERLFD